VEKGIDCELDKINDDFDGLFLEGNINEVNDFLKDVDIKNVETDLLLSYLTATLPAKSKLPYRNDFYIKVERCIKP